MATDPWTSCRCQSDFRMSRRDCHFADRLSQKTHVMKLTIFLSVALLVASQTRSQPHYSFAVSKTGHGSPLIFIPGLECSGDVWKDAVAHFSDRHTCYVLTLPGFAGQPPISDSNILATVVSQLAEYIHENHIQKPVIIGHSLGGWVALAIGVAYPDL